jgi:phosphatidate cytidylyltransferase
MILSFTALAILRGLPSGAWLLGFVLMGSWGCDVFAYFTGVLFGKHKLIPEISPKKTIEGSIGGIVFATLGFLLLGFIMSKTGDASPNYIVLSVAGILCSVVSQIGDLIASLIKREHGIKDYGNIFPGHGGVLDRFDSILAVAPVLYIICVFFPPFV